METMRSKCAQTTRNLLPTLLSANGVVAAGAVVDMGRKGKSRPLSRPKKKKYRGNHSNQFESALLKSRLSTQSEDGRAVQGEGTAPVGDKGVSASRSKLRDLPPFDHSLGLSDSDVSSDDDRDSDDCSEDSSDENELEGYRLVDSSLISSACCCSECGGVLSLTESKKSGLASELSLICCSCGNVSSTMTSKRCERFLEVNRRAVFAARVVGHGREGLVKFCGLMNMPPPLAKASFYDHQKALTEASFFFFFFFFFLPVYIYFTRMAR